MKAFDTETYLIEEGRLPRMVCLTTNDGLIWKADDPTWFDWLMAALDGQVVNQNISFDFAVTIGQAKRNGWDWQALRSKVWRAYQEGRVFDTMIRGLLLGIAAGDSRTKVSLGDQAERLLGETIEGKHGPDVWRMRYAELDPVPLGQWPHEALSYALLDPVYALRVFEAQREILDPIPGEALHTRAAWPLQLMGFRGVRTDPIYVAVLTNYLRDAERAAFATIKASGAGWLRSNGSKDMKALRARIAEALGVDADAPPPELATPKGALRTDREVLHEAGKRAPDLEALANVGRVQTLLRTFVGPLQAREIRPRWWPLVESGRLSCRKPNLTNQPKDTFPTVLGKLGVRECFVPMAGYVYAGADYSGAELRALAQVTLDLFGFSRMAELFREGKDLHRMFAATLASMSYEAVVEHPEFKALRQFAKVPNFGFGGGMGAQRFAENAKTMGVDVTLGGRLGNDPLVAARKLRDLWYRTFPEMKLYHQRIGALVEQQSTIQSHRGGLVRGGVGYADAANHYFQNLVARWTKRALFEVAREGYDDPASPLWGSAPVIVVHDEIIIEAPEERAPEAAERMVEIMIREASALCPDVPIEAEPVLMRRWYKSAETRRDAVGRLIPWEPGE